MTRDPGWTRALLTGGTLMLILPPVGWVMALGFRSVTGERLVRGLEPPLPSWSGNVGEILTRGVKSSGVILGYLSPSIALFFVLGAGGGPQLRAHAVEIALAILAAMIFPPVVIPSLPFVASVRWPWFALDRAEILVLCLLSLTTIVLLPSAFLRVAATGRYAAAFHVRTAWHFARRHHRAYAEAWMLSLVVSAAAVLIVPLMPWLLFWSYLAILHAFLQVLRLDPVGPNDLSRPAPTGGDAA